MANDRVNPLVVSSSELHCILLDIKQNICLHPWLALLDDPDDNIWVYYPIIWVSPVMMEGFLIVICWYPGW